MNSQLEGFLAAHLHERKQLPGLPYEVAYSKTLPYVYMLDSVLMREHGSKYFSEIAFNHYISPSMQTSCIRELGHVLASEPMPFIYLALLSREGMLHTSVDDIFRSLKQTDGAFIIREKDTGFEMLYLLHEPHYEIFSGALVADHDFVAPVREVFTNTQITHEFSETIPGPVIPDIEKIMQELNQKD
ncbi:MAG: hypothetical protein HGA85_06995 [Nanoarchaeota archaeon]|nr:hypothetical protein [Nanoarchaeota archaeon]